MEEAFGCPFCEAILIYKGEGLYVCPHKCAEVWRNMPAQLEALPKVQPLPKHVPQAWPELVEGMPAHLQQGMKDIASIPLGVYEPGVCQGHGGKGGGGKSGRGKSAARQKADAWARKQSPGRFARSIRLR